MPEPEPNVRRFRRGPAEVDAVQVAGDDTGNTARAIAKWCGGAPAGTWDRPRIHVWAHPDGPDDTMTARVGMWITREPDGRYQVHQDREFRATHQAIELAPSVLPVAPRLGGEPTREQLDNLLYRAERHALSHTEAELLTATVRRLADERDRLAARLNTGLVDEADALRRRAKELDRRAADLEDVTLPRLAQAEAAVQRVRDLHRLDHLYEVDCPCPAPGAGAADDVFDAYWERHHRDDDGDVACLDRPVADICPTCIDESGDPHPWPCETGTAVDAQPEPAADTETTAPLTDHWPQGDRDA